MTRSLLVLTLALAACATSGQSLEIGGRSRGYILHLPANRPPGPMPLVIALHGGGGSAKQMVQMTGFDALADRDGFAVVYPESVNGHWNDGRTGSKALPVDDVGFIRALLDHLEATYSIDRQRVFATGISNGGIMSYRLACDLADRIAAIAPVAGAIAEAYAPSCHSSRPVAVLAINGTSDPIVLWNGGEVFGHGGKVIGAEASAELMAVANRCVAEPVTTWEPDHDPADGTVVRRTDYGTCADGTDVELLAVSGGGHTWPGGDQFLPRALIGKVSRELSASKRIWEFFRSHGRTAR